MIIRFHFLNDTKERQNNSHNLYIIWLFELEVMNVPSRPLLLVEWNPCSQEVGSWTARTKWRSTFFFLKKKLNGMENVYKWTLIFLDREHF